MGEKNDEPKYMEGNYSKNPFQAELEYKADLIQAGQLQMQEYYWESYLNAVEKLRKEHHYLVDGAVLRCSKSTTNPIKITQSNGQIVKYEECTEDIIVAGGVILEDPENMECFRAPEGKSEVRLKVLQNTAAKNGAGQYFATVKDTKKGGIGYYFAHDTDDYNIRFFGNCKNAPDRDDECKAIIMAAESKELRNIGTCPYLMKLNDEWENFVSDVNYEEVTTLDGELSELITMEAVLFCKHGGFIMPVTSGQENCIMSLDYGVDKMTQYLRGEGISEEELDSIIRWIADNCGLLVNDMVHGQFSYVEKGSDAYERSKSFDNEIIAWTYYWNIKIQNEFSSKFTIDPNIVKAIIAQESSFGLITANNAAKNPSRNVMQSLATGNSMVWVVSGINPYKNGMFSVGDSISYILLDGTIGKDGALAIDNLPAYAKSNNEKNPLSEERSKKHFEDFDVIRNIFEIGDDGKYVVNFAKVTPNMSIATGIGVLANSIEDAGNLYDGVNNYNTIGNYVEKINSHLEDMGCPKIE